MPERVAIRSSYEIVNVEPPAFRDSAAAAGLLLDMIVDGIDDAIGRTPAPYVLTGAGVSALELEP